MKYYSLLKNSPKVSFREAVINGIAPDRGLYYPENIRPLSPSFFQTIGDKSSEAIAYEAIQQFVGDEIPAETLKNILGEVLDFPFPIVEVEEAVATLELFHGPTMAFKDVGARFMALCLGYFSGTKAKEMTVLVATSGDTGGAVANGFLGVDGVNVVILYPKGKVSDIQEKQLTTLGQNICALEVDGTFDDCQRMVKKAFLDTEITSKLSLTSANSINVARWLPQMFYFLFAYRELAALNKDLVFSVPSGNFGNICAGLVAHRLGMPAKQFVAATNTNDTVPRFMQNEKYDPRPSVQTISNAMDVGDPSNFDRIRHLFGDDFGQLSEILSSYSFDDTRTRAAMKQVYENSGYITDPHGAVGYLGLKEYMASHPGGYGIFLETAHPIKFKDIVEETLGTALEIPNQIQKVLKGRKKATVISSYEELKGFLKNS